MLKTACRLPARHCRRTGRIAAGIEPDAPAGTTAKGEAVPLDTKRGNASARILLVEDDASISDVVSSAMQGEGYACRCAYSGTEAKLLVESGEPFDLAICDLMLPGMSGEDVVALIRSKSSTPILVTSAKAQVVDRVALLRMSADDYLVKPFDLDELVARVEALLRRAGSFGDGLTNTPEDESGEAPLAFGQCWCFP